MDLPPAVPFVELRAAFFRNLLGPRTQRTAVRPPFNNSIITSKSSRLAIVRIIIRRMATRIYPIDEPHRPAPGRNNVWYKHGNTEQVIVFVHGVLSDSSSCWYTQRASDRPGVYWPDLLSSDERFNNCSIYLGGY